MMPPMNVKSFTILEQGLCQWVPFLEMIIQQFKIIGFSEDNSRDAIRVATAGGYEYLWWLRIFVE